MYIDEFKEYLETHSRAYERFIDKAIDYQNKKMPTDKSANAGKIPG